MGGRSITKLDDYGLDQLCDDIASGKTLSYLTKKIGVSVGSFAAWCAKSEHSARVKEARALSAQFWDEQAVETIKKAADPLEVAKARELAFHYRWRASKIAPKEYGDKTAVDVSGGVSFDGLIMAIADKRSKQEQQPSVAEIEGAADANG